MGIVSHKGRNRDLDLTNMGAGNQQAKAIGKAVKLTNASRLLMANNRLSTTGTLEVLRNLSANITAIDLSGNVLQDYEKAKERKMKAFKNSARG